MDADAILDAFLQYLQDRGTTLYPAQEAAILELFDEKNVILNTPTGSGKSLVATALHFKAWAQGKRSVYTCPIKALVNEKWLALCREFGPENVGLSTGDATVNRDAPILCCTAEILANIALREGAETPFTDVVMDEFHYYSDRERGVAWQVPLLTMSNARFLLMSATLGETAFFEEALTNLNQRETVTVRSVDRPVPLEFSYAETPLATTLEELVKSNKHPVYVVHFTQAEAARNAQNFTSLPLCSREQKAAIATALEGFRFNSPYGAELKRWLRSGIGRCSVRGIFTRSADAPAARASTPSVGLWHRRPNTPSKTCNWSANKPRLAKNSSSGSRRRKTTRTGTSRPLRSSSSRRRNAC